MPEDHSCFSGLIQSRAVGSLGSDVNRAVGVGKVVGMPVDRASVGMVVVVGAAVLVV